MAKHKALTAPKVVYAMGLTPPAQMPDGKGIKYGRKALMGQYTKPYVRECPLSETGRISKGARARHKRLHGTEGVLDLSATINAKR